MQQTKSKADIEQRVTDALVEFGEEREAVTPAARLEELEVDSLDLVELAQIIDDEYGVEVTDADMDALQTVGDVVELIAARSA